ncbi:MAG TPA: hypothetical protein PKE63_07350 [Lacibacter sp.]|nr:hypothetical protein [Lacibacter sp.]HMO88757.1 hypothetical protein [Lacibacter sp.]HMP87078.1 hypothetical protein [Lacibacter sp.]
MKWSLPFLLIVLLVGCADAPQQKEAPVTQPDIRVQTGLGVFPALRETDSVQVLFYKNPFGTDSLRYYRFFTYLPTNETAVLDLIKAALDTAVVGMEQKKCRSEGKIYLLQKGEILKTVYFNLRPGSCNHLYFIKDGVFYYLPVSAELETLLLQLKKQAREPRAGEVEE